MTPNMIVYILLSFCIILSILMAYGEMANKDDKTKTKRREKIIDCIFYFCLIAGLVLFVISFFL